MSKIVIEVTEQEKEWIVGYAELVGLNISEAVNRVVVERLEDGGFMSEEDKNEDRIRRLKTLQGVYNGLGVII